LGVFFSVSAVCFPPHFDIERIKKGRRMIHPTATRRRQKGKITQQEKKKKIKMLRFKKRQKEVEIESQ
jgi:hypothetical protein